MPPRSRKNPALRQAKKMQKFLDMDNIYFQFADVINKNSTKIFKEDLSNYDDFRKNDWNYNPILDPIEFPLDYFKSPKDPYLIFEDSFDDKSKRVSRTVRRSYLKQHGGSMDKKMHFLAEPKSLNNTYIKRGIHIIVRDANGTIINDEYGMKGPFPDSPKEDKKLLWYRPHDYIRSDYIMGEELLPTFMMPRSPLFKIQHYNERKAIYFMRSKKSNFLPRCLRETQMSNPYLFHYMDWCPPND